MPYKLTNNTSRLLNFGTKNGSMLLLQPKESKEITEEQAQAYSYEIENYTNGNAITFTKFYKETFHVDNEPKQNKTRNKASIG